MVFIRYFNDILPVGDVPTLCVRIKDDEQSILSFLMLDKPLKTKQNKTT